MIVTFHADFQGQSGIPNKTGCFSSSDNKMEGDGMMPVVFPHLFKNYQNVIVLKAKHDGNGNRGNFSQSRPSK